MRLLVTGSAGLIGRRLTTRLRAGGHEVIGYDLRLGGGDIRDSDALRVAMAGCAGVIHLAAIARVAWGEADPGLCHAVNVESTAHVLEGALALSAAPWVLFASSREVYGDPDRVPVGEDAPLAPVNAYGRSKVLGEQLVGAARGRGLRAAVVRLSNVYGALNDHPDRAVPALLWRALAGQDLCITGADTFFDFVHVDDCVRGLLAVAGQLEAGEGAVPAVHLASRRATTLGDLARSVLAVTESNSGVSIGAARGFDVRGFCGDPARARAVLGWTAEIALEEGIGKLMAEMIDRGRPLDPVTMPGAGPRAANGRPIPAAMPGARPA